MYYLYNYIIAIYYLPYIYIYNRYVLYTHKRTQLSPSLLRHESLNSFNLSVLVDKLILDFCAELIAMGLIIFIRQDFRPSEKSGHITLSSRKPGNFRRRIEEAGTAILYFAN